MENFIFCALSVIIYSDLSVKHSSALITERPLFGARRKFKFWLIKFVLWN